MAYRSHLIRSCQLRSYVEPSITAFDLWLVEDVSIVIEDDAEKAQRLYHLLTGSASGVELYTTELPTNSGGNIGVGRNGCA